ncbi:MAG: hypothetical protein HOB32_08275 [Nitrospina sp.]|nr:hypothetical protein [Nitrospina sp.]
MALGKVGCGVAFLLFIILFAFRVRLGTFLSGEQVRDFLPKHLDHKQSPGDGRHYRLDNNASRTRVQICMRLFTPNQSEKREPKKSVTLSKTHGKISLIL